MAFRYNIWIRLYIYTVITVIIRDEMHFIHCGSFQKKIKAIYFNYNNIIGARGKERGDLTK